MATIALLPRAADAQTPDAQRPDAAARAFTPDPHVSVSVPRHSAVIKRVAAESPGGTTYWHERATQLAAAVPAAVPLDARRMYVYLSLAQFRAATAVATKQPVLAAPVAVSMASVVVMKSFMPTAALAIDSIYAALSAQPSWKGASRATVASHEASGRSIGEQVLVFAQGDRVGLADPGIPPKGPGRWHWSGGPIARELYKARPFFLASPDEFRPAPPPAFGSPEFTKALAEVRKLSDTRTAEQKLIAEFWAINQSPRADAVFSAVALELIRASGMDDRKAAELLFRSAAATFDALIACFDAKYFYWYIRPPQADSAITVPIRHPPHPSYPSAHSCASGAMSRVLTMAFPNQAKRLDGLAKEASLSRMYGGIHYRFDMDAGLEIGRKVADKAAAANLDRPGLLRP